MLQKEVAKLFIVITYFTALYKAIGTFETITLTSIYNWIFISLWLPYLQSRIKKIIKECKL